jgi:signal transduction histidine kinase
VEVGSERDRVLRALEVLVVLVLFALTVVGIFVDVSGPSRWLVAPVFGAAITFPLLVRRRAPLAVVCVVTVAAVLNAAVNGLSAGGAGTWFAWVFAAYAVGGHRDGRRAVIGGLVVAAPTVVIGVLKMRDGEDASALLSPLALLGAVWVAGRVTARRRRRAEEVERRAQELERTAAELAAEAAERERSRIARELHDVVTHGMSVMVVQSQAAQSLAATDADQAREAMRAVEAAGREALGEMRRLLGVIRSDANADRVPQPRLEDVSSLVDRVRQAGLPVTYSTHGESDAVPGGVAVSAYRIVQEALTNVVKHAGAVPTDVEMHLSPAALEVIVANRPATTPPPQTVAGGGSGLAGMRERVAVYDGVLEAGRSDDGGFAVRAVFPVGTP